MKQYQDLLKDILENGREKGDRTGTGTISTFGRQIRFNLQDGFPLLTTKKIFWKGIVHELLWFLKGDTNIKYLNDNGVKIWDEWCTTGGDCGPIYSVPWRKWYIPKSRDIISVERAPYRFDEPFTPKFANEEYDIVESDMDGFTKNGFRVVGKLSNKTKNTHYVIEFDNGYRKTARKIQIEGNSELYNPYQPNEWGYCKGNPKNFDIKNKTHKKLFVMWENMVRRCHYPEHQNYDLYGGKGIFVKGDWKCFESFFNTIHLIPGYHNWVSDPSGYHLDKDYYGANYYSKDSCVFLEKEYSRSLVRGLSKHIDEGVKWILTDKETSISIEDTFVSRLLEENGIGVDHYYFKNNNMSYKNYSLEKVSPFGGHLYRQRIFIDQIKDVIDTLNDDPESRRIIVSGWNPEFLPDTTFSPSENAEMGKQSLPPCHTMFQFYCEELTLLERAEIARYKLDGSMGTVEYIIACMDNEAIPRHRLSCQLYQRSADVFLGVPFNLASYALLTHIIAYICNMQAGDFVHTFGDVHIYSNHVEQVKEQLSRDPRPLPELRIRNRKMIGPSAAPEDFEFGDFELIGYDPHPPIKAEVAV